MSVLFLSQQEKMKKKEKGKYYDLHISKDALFFPFFLYKYIREIISDRGKVGYTLCIQILRKKSIDVPHRLQFKVDIFEKILNIIRISQRPSCVVKVTDSLPVDGRTRLHTFSPRF
jgi:hypothetical protein